MTARRTAGTDGSTVIVILIVVSTILTLLGAAVTYTQHVSRVADRSRKSAQAIEVADGHLEVLFTNWRNIYRMQKGDSPKLPTNYFWTTAYPGAPAAGGGNLLPAPSPIPTPPTSLFPDVPYSLTRYSIQAVNPMIELQSDGETSTLVASATPAPAYGPGASRSQFNYYYLASADVEVPTMVGNVKAKVRRIFEQRYDQAWAYSLFYVDDLEIHPDGELSISGAIHTNANLYIGSNLFTAVAPGPNSLTSGRISYTGEYVNGWSPLDSQHTGTPGRPNFPKTDPLNPTISNEPPSQMAAYMPFGWDVVFNPTRANQKSSYHELVEQPSPLFTTDDAVIGSFRYYNQADIKILIDSTPNPVKIYRPDPTAPLDPSKVVRICVVGETGCTSPANASAGSGVAVTGRENDLAIYHTILGRKASGSGPNTRTAITAALSVGEQLKNTTYPSATPATIGEAMFDAREGYNTRLVTLDIGLIKDAVDGGAISGFKGIIYISDTTAMNADGTRASTVNSFVHPTPTPGASPTPSPVSCTGRGIRLRNATILPSGNTSAGNTVPGLTIVSENPIYIQGDYNTGGTTPATNTITTSPTSTTSPTTSNYTRKPAAVIGDAVTLLSAGWSDLASTTATSSTGRAASANTTVNAALVSGNVPSNGVYSGGAENFIRFLEDWNQRRVTYYGSMVQLYKSTQATGEWKSGAVIYKQPKLFWFYDNNLMSAPPPGNFKIASYHQQQRWYQVY